MLKKPIEFVKHKEERKVYRLHKALYELKQAPRTWNKKIDSFLKEKDFVKYTTEHGVYVRRSKSELLILCLYVDNLLITGSCKSEIEDFKDDLGKEFEMSDLGDISYFLDIKLYKSNRGLMMHQRIYASEILKRFEMEDDNATSTHAEPRLQLSKDLYEDDVDPT